LENPLVAKHLIISGRVQGVGFRYSMAEEAKRLGVTGWVRNRRDGTVESVVDGDPHALEAILAWARRGPPSARVTGVDASEIAGSFQGFEMQPTA
jgi:acylphosphatase